MKKFLILSSLFLLLIPLGVQAVQSFLTFYVNVMDYGTVLMLQNQSNVLTIYEIPSSFSSVPSFQGVQTTGKALEAVENVTLKSGEVALVHEYGVSGFSTQNFIYQQVNVPGIVTYSNSTTSYYSSSTLSVTPNPGYQLQFTPWFGIQNQPVDSVESTSWKVLPYWQNGELVINSTGTSVDGQYIAWRYSPISNVINATIHVTSYASMINTASIAFYSTNLQSSPYFMVAFYTGAVWYLSSTANELATFPTPNPPFTMSVILTENSAGNVTVQSVIINGTTTYNLNTSVPFKWNQIAYIAIRTDPSNLFYVSYFGVSPSPYYNAEQFINNVESTSWKVFPYWQNGELVVNSTGASNGGQYVAWRYSPISNTINITIHVISFPVSNNIYYPAITVYSPNVGDQTSDLNSGFYALFVDFYGGAIGWHSPTSGGFNSIYTSLPQPNPNYPFTFSVILTENSAGNITVQSVYSIQHLTP